MKSRLNYRLVKVSPKRYTESTMGGIPSANFEARNLADMQGRFEVVHTFQHDGEPWQIVTFPAPYVRGFEFWVINDKGYLWEGRDSLQEALAYVDAGCE